MSEIQKDFETWFMEGDEDMIGVLKFTNGRYDNKLTHESWITWQAGWYSCRANRTKRMMQ